MFTKRSRLFCVTVVALALAATPLAAAPPQGSGPVVTFEKNALVATGTTPNGRVVFFGETLDDAPYTEIAYGHREHIIVADAAGLARFNLGADLPTLSLWAVVDVNSGSYTVAAPPGQTLKELKVPPGLFKKGLNGNLTDLDVPFEMTSTLVARPGNGVWKLFNAEGGPGDQPGHGRGRTVSSIAQFKSLLDQNGPPAKFEKGDVVIVIEPRFLFYYVVKVVGQ